MNKHPRLSPQEEFEFKHLGKLLFDGNAFVVFSKEEENSPLFKRYDELLRKKLAHLSEISRLVMSN